MVPLFARCSLLLWQSPTEFARPAVTWATHAWLQRHSGLGELLRFDFEAMDLNPRWACCPSSPAATAWG